MGTRVALRHLGIVLCELSLGLAAPVRGAEWSFEPAAAVRTEYNTNVQLTPEPHPSVWGAKVSSDVKFSGATEALTVTGGLNLSLDRYPGHPEFNIDNYDLSVHSSYKAERNILGLNLDAIRSATTVNELATTGVVLAYRPQDQLIVAPFWSRALTERTAVDTNYTFTLSKYGDTSGTNLTENLYQVASLGMHSAIDERKVFNFAVFYERYETRPSQVLQNSYGVRAGYDHVFSETLQSSVRAGWRWTQTTISSQAMICDAPIVAGICTGMVTETAESQKENSSGFTLNAVLEKRFEADTLNGELSQDAYPSGAGSLVQTQRAAVRWKRQWSPTLNSDIETSAYQSKYIGGVVTQSDSRYLAFNAALTWRLSDYSEVNVGYNYARQKTESIDVAAHGNIMYVGLRYTWPKLSISR